jgi:hypothetical protein
VCWLGLVFYGILVDIPEYSLALKSTASVRAEYTFLCRGDNGAIIIDLFNINFSRIFVRRTYTPME